MLEKMMMPMIKSFLRDVTLKIDVERRVAIITKDKVTKEFTFDELEKYVNNK